MLIRDVLVAFVEFREQVITRRTIFELAQARNKAHMSWSAWRSPSPISTR